MTEPAVASSDATNITTSIRRDGDSYVINGRKWWSSGAMDPRCTFGILMGKTEFSAAKHKQQSMVIIPMDAPGVKILRYLSVFDMMTLRMGMLRWSSITFAFPNRTCLAEGAGFQIAQGRL